MNNSPAEILEIAEMSHQKRDFKVSLESYQWFFDNAVQIDSVYVGAKYARALKGWYRIALEYPPAYDALVQRKKNCLSF